MLETPPGRAAGDKPPWLLKVREELAGHGLAVGRALAGGAARAAGFLVQGGTFQLEATLAGVGAVWDPAARAWRLGSVGQLLALAAALRPAAADGEEAAYGRAPGGEEAGDRGLREGDAAPFLSGEHAVGRRLSPWLRRVAELPAEYLEPGELLAVVMGLGAGLPEPEKLAGDLLARFGGLGALLGAESGRYAECLPPPEKEDEEVAASLWWRRPDQRREQLWELATLLKALRELHQRLLGERLKDRPVIGSWDALVAYLGPMQHEAAEHFRILFLDKKNILIRDEVQSRGTVDHTPLYPREVVKRALELAASAIIMVHNHPSGDPTPSGPDVEMTRQVAAALGQVGIAVHDHIIVGKNRHASFRGLKLL